MDAPRTVVASPLCHARPVGLRAQLITHTQSPQTRATAVSVQFRLLAGQEPAGNVSTKQERASSCSSRRVQVPKGELVRKMRRTRKEGGPSKAAGEEVGETSRDTIQEGER